MRACIALLILLLGGPIAAAQEPAPADQAASEASIHELIDVTQTSRLVDDMYARVDALMKQSLQEVVSGQALTEEQRALLEEMQGRILAVFQEQFSWRQMEPKVIDIYRRSFTQHEIDGMLEFYRTDAGQAVIAKMPLVMENTMAVMQEDLRVMMPRIREIQEDTIARLRATRSVAPTP
jgi:hypothetical protein